MYHYKAHVSRVVDADTFDLSIDLGMGITISERVRLIGINAWEVRGAEREKGKEASRFVIDWLTTNCAHSDVTGEPEIFVRTELDSAGKFGRLLVWVFASEADTEPESSLNRLLVTEGHAKEEWYR